MKYSDEDVLEFCDGTLNEERSAEIQRELQRDDDLAFRIEAMKASRLPYKEAFAQQLTPELPKSLHAYVKNLVHQVHGVSSAAPPNATAGRFSWLYGFGQHMRFASTKSHHLNRTPAPRMNGCCVLRNTNPSM